MLSDSFKKFVARAIPSTAALTLAVGAIPATANAVSLGACQSAVNDPGGTSPSSPDNIGTICAGSTITFGDETLPRYWEFTWGSTTPATDISAQGSFYIFGPYNGNPANGNPFGNLELLNAAGTTVTSSAAFSTPQGFLDYMTTADLGPQALALGQMYEVGITASPQAPIDPSGTIFFGTVPEPASLTLLGSALAGLAAFRRRRRKQAA